MNPEFIFCLTAETAAQAVAYAQHQQSYLAHHQSAMQLEQQMHQAAVAGAQEAVSVHATESKSVDGNNNFFISIKLSALEFLSVHLNLLLV